MTTIKSAHTHSLQRRFRAVPVIGPGARKLLITVFALFALLAVDSLYLVSVTFIEWSSARIYQDYFYQVMFLIHLILGLAIILPVVIFGAMHLRNAYRRPNRRAVRAGLALYLTALLLLLSGVMLTRFEFFEINDPELRGLAYWIHVITPVLVIGLFVLHRLAGRRIRWKLGARWVAFAGVFAVVMLIVNINKPQQLELSTTAEDSTPFSPSLARTVGDGLIPARSMMMQDYCRQCHEDVTESWDHSVHRFSSFNNPAYLFSVRETRKVVMQRNGDMRASRFCAGCHDPVPLFSGAFDDPDFDDQQHPTAKAGLTCTACHAISRINSLPITLSPNRSIIHLPTASNPSYNGSISS
jgi:hypothetical protein